MADTSKTRRIEAVLTWKAGFQSISDANRGAWDLVGGKAPTDPVWIAARLGTGTGGAVVRVPVGRVPQFLRGLAAVLEGNANIIGDDGKATRVVDWLDGFSVSVQGVDPKANPIGQTSGPPLPGSAD